MKILLDPLIFNLQNYGGISRYYAEVLKILTQKKEVNIDCPLYITENLHLKNYGFGESLLVKIFQRHFPGKVNNYLRQKSFDDTTRLLKSAKYDLFIPTYYNTGFLNYIGITPFVLTVYDMIHETYPELEKESTIVHDKKLLIESATKVIAISKNTKDDILRFYPHISKDKIHVVYLSHSITKKEFGDQHRQKIIGKSQYILFVGNRGFYKNFNWFLPVVSDWLKENDVKLLCLGGGSFNDEENNNISDLGLKDFVKQYTFQDDELYFFYNRALAFIFPSEYEGFGIPILEAMYSGCPVLLPKLTSFPEVAGEAGEYFDLSDNQSLVDFLDKLNSNQEYRDQLIGKGLKQADKFSWKKTVDECFEIYKAAIF